MGLAPGTAGQEAGGSGTGGVIHGAFVLHLLHLQPSDPHYGVGHSSCVGSVEYEKRVRREPLGASCLGHSQVRGRSPSCGHPHLPQEKQQLQPGDQDPVSAMFETISCSCRCTLHPHHPKASFDGEVPISHPAAVRVPCGDALWGQEEESEPWVPHTGQSSFLSSLPWTAAPRHSLAKLQAVEPAALLGWLAKSLLLCEGEVSLGKPSSAPLGPARPQALADWAGDAITPPKERHLAPGVW